MRVRLFLLAAGVLLSLPVFSIQQVVADSNVLFIFDASGSMKKKLENGQTRMAIAKQAMADSLQSMPDDVRVGLLLYGHRRAKDCKDIELVSPIGADDTSTIAQTVKGLEAKGETPIADSLKQAARSFATLKGQSNRVILVTDGIEECKGDPCAAAQSLKDSGLDLKVDIVGFTLNDEQRKTIECVAKTTGGQYYDAQDPKGLTAALTSVKEEVVQAAPPRAIIKPTEKVFIQVTSPNDAWLATVDGKTDAVSWMWKGQEAVYGFAGGRSASFDTFGVFIDRASGNPKQFEILVGDESPSGSFRSLGICEVSNMALKTAPYQQCKFEPVTAHFVKVKLVDTYSGDGTAWATEFQINATLSPESTALPAAKGSSIVGATNLLSASNMETSPSDVWLATVDGKTDTVAWMWPEQQAVYSFGSGRSAEFDTFSVFIPGTHSYPKTFELLVSDEGPLSEFRSIATCEFANAKMLKEPFQPCSFAAVTAKYLKVRYVGNHSGGDNSAYATEFKLLGKVVAGTEVPAPAPAPGIDLLSAANGGSFLGSNGSKAWEATLDGKTQNVAWLWSNQEAIYAFKGEALATFDTFAVYSNGTYSGNPKEFEILAGTEGPTGQFRSVAICSVANTKVLKKPYQECRFEPVTAKYIKVKLVSSNAGDGTAWATEFKLFGQLTQ